MGFSTVGWVEKTPRWMVCTLEKWAIYVDVVTGYL